MLKVKNKRFILLYISILVSLMLSNCRKAPEDLETSTQPFKLVTHEDLLSVTLPDDDHIWIVGFKSTILHSSDGGINWVFQKSPISTDLFNVFFMNNKNGFIAGKHGTILHTTDGGNTWVNKSENTKTDQRLINIHFVDLKEGWVVGTFGTILHTEDGGNTWEKQGWDEDKIYNNVYFVDNQTGWIVGEYGTIYHTEDGGNTWVKQECKDIIPVVDEWDWEPPLPSLYDVYFQNADKGWAVGLDGVLIFTENGGTYWRKLDVPVELSLFQVIVIDDRGWAVGLRGNYIVSTDGGKSWELNEEAIKTKFWLRGLDFSNQKNGFAVGSLGTIVHTADKGKSWQMISGITIDQ